MIKIILACALTAAQAYLLGSVIFGVIIAKVFYHDDVRTHGSGSAGMTNMLRNYGKLAGALTAVGDLGKGMLAVVLGRWLFAVIIPDMGLASICGAYLAAIFAVIGHTKPLFFGFKGGKGVLISAGAALATEPLVCVILFLIFMVEFAITRMVSLGSIIIAVLYPLATLSYWVWHGVNLPSAIFIGVCTGAMAVMVIYMHRENIRRIKEGTEYRFGEKKPHVK
ncbi:MAG: glycerol-3-phosphate 1-O-acyltransferase PlsY [Gemmiger sp.]|nr:glycerol-3-phosphate 1-O-acyltransferase PlsY [Gemmiger sp.]